MRLDASSLEKYDTSSQNWLIFSKAGIWLVPFQVRTRKGVCPTAETSLIQKLWLLGRERFRNRSLKCKCILCSRTDALGMEEAEEVGCTHLPCPRVAPYAATPASSPRPPEHPPLLPTEIPTPHCAECRQEAHSAPRPRGSSMKREF